MPRRGNCPSVGHIAGRDTSIAQTVTGNGPGLTGPRPADVDSTLSLNPVQRLGWCQHTTEPQRCDAPGLAGRIVGLDG